MTDDPRMHGVNQPPPAASATVGKLPADYSRHWEMLAYLRSNCVCNARCLVAELSVDYALFVYQ